MKLKKIATGAALAGVVGFGAVGLGAGIANAAPPAPVVAGWAQDHDGHWGHWGGDGGGDWDNGGNWGGGNWGYGPDWNRGGNWGPGGWGCVTGPLGFVTFCP
jgi:hypothetical protein